MRLFGLIVYGLFCFMGEIVTDEILNAEERDED
jgi:hypothetical protein